MAINQAEAVFRERLGRRAEHTAGTLLDDMLAFYREVRFDVGRLEKDGDGLLVQWGTYDWGDGRHYSFDLTRQFMLVGDDEPYQLSATLRYAPSDERMALGEANEWCFSLDECPAFEKFIRASRPYGVLANVTPLALRVHFEQV